ncbi:Retroviral aspartyl protease [Corchorus olitorius]|uniref:Retroviral aspartyl protease n=1 Tax=Corchorus olitorius TaxID=93759 RepID=A0A1R3GDF9_9ROSI|nr:Retroviral aspartyl protease [Corchorus olitorius]
MASSSQGKNPPLLPNKPPNRAPTRDERDDRRKKGLCWGPGDDDTLPELDEYIEEVTPTELEAIAATIDPVLSLHAILGTSGPQTMRVMGIIKQQQVIILIDSGSSHNFIDRGVAKRLGCILHSLQGVGVTVAKGDKLWATQAYYDVTWHTQGLKQCTSFMLLPLSGCDVVLGVEWLSLLGPILWDFSTLTMQFSVDGKQHHLQGIQAGSLQLMSTKDATRLSSTICNTLAMILSTTQSDLPLLDDVGLISKEPIAILEHRINKHRGRMITEVLVQWSNFFPEDATWEYLHDLQQKFPAFNP